MAKKTQGTQLWFNDPNNGATLVGCVTTISGITASRDQIETTCLDSTARTYEPGMLTPGNATFGINFEPTDDSHVRLHELYRLGTKVDWALGWSDGTAAATAESNGEFDLDESRSWILFNGYISELPFEFAINTVVASTVGVQISDFPELFPKQTS